MEFRELSIDGAWEITPRLFRDSRGVFLEAFAEKPFAEAVGHPFTLRQANCSVSAAGVVRGIHFAQVPPGQAKYVTCPRGAILDYVVDIRLGSPTFGRWDSVLLDDVDRRSVYVSEGLGHMFVSLEDDSTVMYLCSEPYAPGREFGISPFCGTVGIDFPERARTGGALELRLSDKDRDAPDLREAERLGILPDYSAQQDHLKTLREE